MFNNMESNHSREPFESTLKILDKSTMNSLLNENIKSDNKNEDFVNECAIA